MSMVAVVAAAEKFSTRLRVQSESPVGVPLHTGGGNILENRVVAQKTMEDRFWAKVDKSGDCWLWTASKDKDGYGKFAGNFRAHRWAWSWANGAPAPKDKVICHTCDTPACVRPDHLFTGSHRDNVHDAIRKGRNIHGGQNHQARLSDDAVREMRLLRSEGDSLKALAGKFGVSEATISRACRHKKWKHV